MKSLVGWTVLQVLRKISHDGWIVVCSIHQQSSHLLEDLLLLSFGETIYFGDAKSAVKVINEFNLTLYKYVLRKIHKENMRFNKIYIVLQFFAEAGFPCPTRRNPSDHFLRCINSDIDKIAAIHRQYSQSESVWIQPK